VDILDYFRKVDTISVDEAKKVLKTKEEKNIALVDVRQPEEYERGHIPGAQFIPLADILKRKEEIDPSRTVITYCARGRRSRSAAILLQGQGYDHVLSMDGGIEAWEGATAKGQYEQGMHLLEGRETIEELISMAWALEEGTRTFYTGVKDLVDDNKAKKIFDALIKAEKKHKQMLFKALENIKGKDNAEEIFSRETLKGAMEGGISVDSTLARLEEEETHVEDIIELSMQIEVNSLDLYIKISRRPVSEDTMQTFTALIEEEESHLSWLGKIIGSRLSKQAVKG
jgi:rhodanese-related sulfurtransferase